MRTILLVLSISSVVWASSYDQLVVKDRPVLFLAMSAASASGTEADLSKGDHVGNYHSQHHFLSKTTMPNGDRATIFNGVNEYLEVASTTTLSVRPGRALTFEAWIRPDVLEFPHQESDGYVHWAGKGDTNEYEYALRMYSLTNSASRPNRISGYVFNPNGGLGSGSYFQDKVKKGEWIHVAVIIDTRVATRNVTILKNGVVRKVTPLSQFNVSPEPGDAPLRIATRDLHSFFKGAIGKVAVYSYALTEAQIKAHFNAM